MGKNSAEYMRAYRARRKATELRPEEIRAATAFVHAADRIVELEEEVRHLKAELAKPHTLDMATFNDGIYPSTRKAQQAERDAILRKINRGG